MGACVKIQYSEVKHHLTHEATKLIKHEAVLDMKQPCLVVNTYTYSLKSIHDVSALIPRNCFSYFLLLMLMFYSGKKKTFFS